MSGKLPESLPEAEAQAAKRAMLIVGSAIIFKRKFYFTSYVGPLNGNRSCVEAAIDRGNWLARVLPVNWFVDIYTWRSMLHTANVAYFKGSDGMYHCWIVDGYGYPVTQNAIEYLTSQNEVPGDSLVNNQYQRTMKAMAKIAGVFPARCMGTSI